MTTTRRIIPIVGLIGIAAFALYMVTQLHAQSDVPPADFTNASIAEVHNREGHVLLRGQFAVADDQNDDDVERKAALQTAGTDEDATGQAEIEFAKTAPKLQEIEFSVRNLGAGRAGYVPHRRSRDRPGHGR